MKRFVLANLLTLPALIAGLPASAAPQLPVVTSQSVVEKARHDCRWVDNKWTVRRGDKVVVCRPHRPQGGGWSWHREGNRYGWWHGGRKSWHHNAW